MADCGASCTDWYEVIVCGWFNVEPCRGVTHSPVHAAEELNNVLSLRTRSDLNGEEPSTLISKAHPTAWLLLELLSNRVDARTKVESRCDSSNYKFRCSVIPRQIISSEEVGSSYFSAPNS